MIVIIGVGTAIIKPRVSYAASNSVYTGAWNNSDLVCRACCEGLSSVYFGVIYEAILY